MLHDIRCCNNLLSSEHPSAITPRDFLEYRNVNTERLKYWHQDNGAITKAYNDPYEKYKGKIEDTGLRIGFYASGKSTLFLPYSEEIYQHFYESDSNGFDYKDIEINHLNQTSPTNYDIAIWTTGNYAGAIHRVPTLELQGDHRTTFILSVRGASANENFIGETKNMYVDLDYMLD